MASTVTNREQFTENDPRRYSVKLRDMLQDVSQKARQDIAKVEDRNARILFEVTAEVLDGLTKAFRDFEKQDELAWR